METFKGNLEKIFIKDNHYELTDKENSYILNIFLEEGKLHLNIHYIGRLRNTRHGSVLRSLLNIVYSLPLIT
jgi:hypothetical protein